MGTWASGWLSSISVQLPASVQLSCLLYVSRICTDNPLIHPMQVLPAHLASALELRKKNELFARGHKRVPQAGALLAAAGPAACRSCFRARLTWVLRQV